jgi:hypothetical protein
MFSILVLVNIGDLLLKEKLLDISNTAPYPSVRFSETIDGVRVMCDYIPDQAAGFATAPCQTEGEVLLRSALNVSQKRFSGRSHSSLAAFTQSSNQPITLAQKILVQEKTCYWMTEREVVRGNYENEQKGEICHI